MKKMTLKILFLTIGRKRSPSTRFRVRQYIDFLVNLGHEVRVEPIPHAFFKRFSLVSGVQWADVVVVQKKLFSRPESWVLTCTRKPVLYDFDDNVSSEHPRHVGIRRVDKKIAKNKKRFAYMCKRSDAVIVGNVFLGQLARLYNKNVFVIPTPIDVERYSPSKQQRKGGTVVVGWIGTKSNLFYLDRIKPVLLDLANSYDVVFKVVADEVYSIDNVNSVFKEWSEDDEIEDIRGFDIGIMPLTDDDWSRGKCGFKLIQYMSVGLPVVASPVGVNAEIIEHGINGFLASDLEEWGRYLSLLIENEEVRTEMGLRGRQLVVERFSVSSCGRLLEEVLQTVVCRCRGV